MSYINEILMKYADSPAVDAFGKLRISEPFTIFDSKQLYDNVPLLWDDAQTSGSGTTSTFSANRASSTLAVSSNTAGTRIRQTKRWFNYQPGKSQLVVMSAVLGTATAGVTKRIGQYETSNGLYFELVGTTLNVVRRTNVTGSVVNNQSPQSTWNLDKLDGTGPSGVVLDVTKSNIYLIDYEWLGVGRVRFGIIVNGIIVYCHQMLHSNSLTSVYMSTPNLPVRLEISNDGTGAASTLEQICLTVISGGGQQDTGLVMSASNGNTPVVAASAGTIYACIGLKLRADHIGATVKSIASSFLSTTNDNFHWQLLLNPTIAGTFTYSNITNSALQVAFGATANTVTGGTLINSGYVLAKSNEVAQLIDVLAFGSKIDGTLDSIVIAVMPLGTASNLSIFSSITWRELY